MALFLTALSVRLSSCTLSVLALSIGSKTLNKGLTVRVQFASSPGH